MIFSKFENMFLEHFYKAFNLQQTFPWYFTVFWKPYSRHGYPYVRPDVQSWIEFLSQAELLWRGPNLGKTQDPRSNNCLDFISVNDTGQDLNFPWIANKGWAITDGVNPYNEYTNLFILVM